ncbi:MAG: hypothetical protein ABJG78_02270 [Cyclobacteriaceae bacterium]
MRTLSQPNRLLTFFVFVFLLGPICSAQNLLETEKWKKFFSEKPYLKKGAEITDDKFWEIDESYTYYQNYTLLIIFSNGATEELKWQYDGLPNLLNKKQPLLDKNFETLEKQNIAYIVFDNYLLRNSKMGNAISGDFTFVLCEGPVSIYREYYSSPITPENTASGFMYRKEGKIVSDFYLGKFEKKAAKLVGDHSELAEKIRGKKAGYFNTEADMLRIANEYNLWVQENYPYRYEDWAGLQFDL